MNSIIELNKVQMGNKVTSLCHNPPGEKYFVEQYDEEQSDGESRFTEFSYRVGVRTENEAKELAEAEFRRMTSDDSAASRI